MPDPAVPAPRPLTDEELAEWKESASDLTPVRLRLVATVEELQAEVESLRTRLAATTSVIRRYAGGWYPVVRPHADQYEWVRALQPGPDGHYDQPVEPITPDEVAVLDATRDNHDD